MKNFLLSLILGLCLLVAAAFYAWVAGAVLCRILIDLRRACRAMARRDQGIAIRTAGRRISLTALAGILLLSAAAYAWSATPLLRCCSLVAVAAMPAAWLLARHIRD